MKVTINKQLLVSIEEMEATRYTLMLFQMAYPEKIKINKSKVKGGIHIECWLLNEDKEPHMLLFDGGPFPTEEMANDTIQKLLTVQLDKQ